MSDSSPFYLTRQLANTLEELARHARTQSAVFSISGSEGIGKSRLIERFLETRSQVQQAVIFSADAGGVFKEQGAGPVNIERIFDSMKEKDLVFVDQTEQIDCQQILDLASGWKRLSAQGKVCMLVLVGRVENYCANELSSLFNPGQLFELKLKPLNIDESRDFLKFRLGISDDLQLRLNSTQRSRLKSAKGKFHELAELCSNLAGTVSTKRSTTRSIRTYLVGGFSVLVLLVGAGYAPVLLEKHEPMQVASPVSEKIIELNNLLDEDNTPENSKMPEPLDLLPVVNPVKAIEVPHAVLGENDETKREESSVERLQPGSSVTGDSMEITQNNVALVSNDDLLTQRLRATTELIARSSDKTGTIQLITLEMAELKWDPIVDYMHQLQREGIDLRKVFIYNREQDSQVVIGVLYGEYDNSALARENIQKLPKKLRKNRPFPRSMKGVKKEMRGL